MLFLLIHNLAMDFLSFAKIHPNLVDSFCERIDPFILEVLLTIIEQN